MLVDRPLCARIASEFGTPCFVYFMDQVYGRIDALRESFGGRFSISYAVKSNPNRAVLERLKSRVESLDISSGGELQRALSAGWAPARLSFTGPGKRPKELEAAVRHGIGEIVVESVHEARQIETLAKRQETRQRILVRVAPRKLPRGFGVNMAGRPCQFGIDEEDLDGALQEIKALAHLDVCGFHIYSGTQCLEAKSIAENYEIYVEIFRRFSVAHGLQPERLVFGSGIGIPYHEGTAPVDLAPVAERVNPLIDELRSDPRFSRAICVLETGRYLIGEAGIYLTRVISRKVSRGVRICICDGGMNHHLGACGHLGSVIHRNYRMFKAASDEPDIEQEPYDLVGPLCTSIDTLGHGVQFPGLGVGDLVGVHCSGAYGPTASPVNFISHEPPREIIVESRGGQLEISDVSEFPVETSVEVGVVSVPGAEIG